MLPWEEGNTALYSKTLLSISNVEDDVEELEYGSLGPTFIVLDSMLNEELVDMEPGMSP